jgi:hypothetical protein
MELTEEKYKDLEGNEGFTENEYYNDLKYLIEAPHNIYFKKSIDDHKAFPEENIRSFRFSLTDKPIYTEIRNRFDLQKIAGNGDDFQKAVNIMNWIGQHSCYSGSSRLKSRNTLEMTEKYFDKGFAGAIN